MKKNTFFITGTDTDIGKTYVTIGLINFFKKNGNSVIGMKPISAGLENLNGNMINADVLHLMEANSINFSKDEINPYAFKDPASPHIVSTMENISIDFDLIKKQVQTLMDKSDYLFIEGAGGYDCPLDKSRNVSDLIEYINVPLIIVVGIKLGCLSHAILTMKAIEQKNQKIFGWIANIVDSNMDFQEENISYLRKKIKHPYLGCIPYVNNRNNIDISDYILWPSDV
ncbi:MAG: dethiobiotin synthase [Methylophilaceae bacterium]